MNSLGDGSSRLALGVPCNAARVILLDVVSKIAEYLVKGLDPGNLLGVPIMSSVIMLY